MHRNMMHGDMLHGVMMGGGMMDGMMGGGMMDGMMGGGAFMWLWAIFAVLVLALLVVGVVWLVRTLARPSPDSTTSAARQELDLRYARGDLTREEYQQRRADLEGRS
jgi:putative membrane protein